MIYFLDFLGIGTTVENVVTNFSFWICRMIYPLIDKLYSIFQLMSNHRFFTESDIRNMSKNIYVLVSVVMLFAFATKLLMAIVNPDLLSDTKKGVAGVFIRALGALMLIVVVPWGFDTAYQIQDRVLNSGMIEKIVLGKTQEQTANPGNILEGYTLSSFVRPTFDISKYKLSKVNINELTSAELKQIIVEDNSIESDENTTDGVTTGWEDFFDGLNGNEPANNTSEATISGTEIKCPDLYLLTMEYPSYFIDSFKDCMTVRDSSQNYVFKYNGLLAPIAGFVIAYEMFLFCMDIVFRTLKLGLLELIAPIVICGFIFEKDILSKWFKEVISTYILVFVKLAAITFIVYSLSLVTGFMERNLSSANFSLLIRVLIIIGLLQLLKQIVPIVNAVFGTNIKDQGGIKGRLGEMALVGDMAQKAWTSLGNKAKGLGKTLAVAPVAGAGAGIKKGWNALAKRDDLALGRFARASQVKANQLKNGQVGRAFRLMKAGIGSNGQGTLKALKDQWGNDAVTKAAKAEELNEQIVKRNEKNNINKSGTATEFADERLNHAFNADEWVAKIDGRRAGESDKDYQKRIDKYNQDVIAARKRYDDLRKAQLDSDWKNVANNIAADTNISSTGKQALTNLGKALEDHAKLEEAKANQDKFISFIEAARNNAMDADERARIEGLLGYVKSNGFYKQSLDKQWDAIVQQIAGPGGSIQDFYAKVGGVGQATKMQEFVTKFNSLADSVDGVVDKGASAMAAQVETKKTDVELAKNVVTAYKDSLTDDTAKREIDAYENTYTVKAKEKAQVAADSTYYTSAAGMQAAGSKKIDYASEQSEFEKSADAIRSSGGDTAYKTAIDNEIALVLAYEAEYTSVGEPIPTGLRDRLKRLIDLKNAI